MGSDTITLPRPKRVRLSVLDKLSAAFIVITLFLAIFRISLLRQEHWNRSEKDEPNRVLSKLSSLTSEETTEKHGFTILRGANGRTVNLARYGFNYGVVGLPKSQMLKLQVIEELGPAAFNLAVLRMPNDVKWPFIGIARAPLNYIKHNSVPDTNLTVELNSLLGFGMELTEHGTFRLLSKARFLLIPMRPAYKCGTSAIFQGPEDPRPYWSEDGRPMLIMGVPSLMGNGHCRAIGLIHDLRSTWPELTAVLAGSQGVAPFDVDPQSEDIVELTWNGAQYLEKNWMPFFPGPKPDKAQRMPYMHYQSHPEDILVPPSRPFRKGADEIMFYDYKKKEQPALDASACLVKHHPHVFDKIHGATPLYRLTLCNRGTCTPDITNTVFVSLNHFLMEEDKDGKRAYTRFFSFWSTTSDIAPIAIGPMFQYNGPDNTNVVYALTMTFAPKTQAVNVANLQGWVKAGLSSWQESKRHIESDRMYGLGHGFLDDRLFVSMGVNDSQLATIELSIMHEMLHSLRSCDSSTTPASVSAWLR